MIQVLFVCLGNICRSAISEGFFMKLKEEKKLEDKIQCDSAGTSNYHHLELPDERTRKNARSHQLELTHLSRQIKTQDFEKFDYILAMDQSNLENINQLKKTLRLTKEPKIILFREFDIEKDDMEVPDPYFGTSEGFEEVYQIVVRSAKGFLDYLLEKEVNHFKQI